MKAIAWKHRKKNENNFTYQLQIDGISGRRQEKKLLKTLTDWQKIGEGSNMKNKEMILIFIKEFTTARMWAKWAKKFPFKLEEEKANGTIKKLN